MPPDTGLHCYRLRDEGPPLRVWPVRRPARYSRADDAEPTQYLALHPLGPLAELARANDLRRPEQLAALQTRLWMLRLPPLDLLEVDFASAHEHGLDAADLVSDDHAACQAL